ncbi:hypothetical protein JXB12_07320 [candidate division KSB1 bacterium]|nr:hypothetical protein [candidate division KSB1 bacterium]
MDYDFSALIIEAQQKMQRGLLEPAIRPLINALESFPLGNGAADALYLIGIVHMETLDGHRCEISCLLSHRLRATLIDPDIEFRNLVNLTRACLNQKSFSEAYTYGKIAEQIVKDDEDLMANMLTAGIFSGLEKELEISRRYHELQLKSPTHAAGVISIIEGRSNIKRTNNLSCDDLVDKFESNLKSGDFEDYKRNLNELLQKPDGINSWKCWKILTEMHIAMKPADPSQEYLRLQEMAGVAAASGKAIEFHPKKAKDNQKLWHWRGNALGQMCLYDMAVEALQTADSIKPGNKDVKESLDYCREMMSLSPDHVSRPDSMAWLENRRKEMMKVRNEVKRCPKCGSHRIRFLGSDMITCDHCYYIGPVKSAYVEFFKEFLLKKVNHNKIEGGDRMTREEAAKLTNDAYNAVERGDFAGAKRLLERALQLCEDIPDTHSEYAFVLSTLGEYNRARDHFLRAIQLSPSNPKFWVNLGKWYFDRENYSEALTCILHAEKLDSSYPTIEVAKMHIANAMGATPDVIEAHRKKALELYNNRGRRADGSPLQPGDIEKIVSTNYSAPSIRTTSTSGTGCSILIVVLLLSILIISILVL